MIPSAPDSGDENEDKTDPFDLPGFIPETGVPESTPPKPEAQPPRPLHPRAGPGRGRPKHGPRPAGHVPPRKFPPREFPKPDAGDRRLGYRQTYRPGAGREYEDRIAPEVRKFLPLKTEKGRYRDSRFLIEGVKNIADAVAISPEVIYAVLVARGFEDAKLAEILRRHRVRVQEVHPNDLSALCDTETPQGVVAVANFAALRPDWNAARSITLLDGVQDPGNVGSILRTSAALGMDAVVLGKGTCDAYNPKVVRSSIGSLLRLPLETGEDLGAKIHFLRTKGFSVVATSPHAKLTLTQAKLRRKVALLFGNEGAGVGENLIDQADETVRIPMRAVESLNVAVAHGILAYELMRVRA